MTLVVVAVGSGVSDTEDCGVGESSTGVTEATGEEVNEGIVGKTLAVGVADGSGLVQALKTRPM